MTSTGLGRPECACWWMAGTSADPVEELLRRGPLSTVGNLHGLVSSSLLGKRLDAFCRDRKAKGVDPPGGAL